MPSLVRWTPPRPGVHGVTASLPPVSCDGVNGCYGSIGWFLRRASVRLGLGSMGWPALGGMDGCNRSSNQSKTNAMRKDWLIATRRYSSNICKSKQDTSFSFLMRERLKRTFDVNPTYGHSLLYIYNNTSFSNSWMHNDICPYMHDLLKRNYIYNEWHISFISRNYIYNSWMHNDIYNSCIVEPHQWSGLTS